MLLACLFVLWLFRQPTRKGAGIVSSIDGTIQNIQCLRDTNRIAITRSTVGTVGLRAPISGVVKKVTSDENHTRIIVDNGSFEVVCIYRPGMIGYTNIYVTRGSAVKRSAVMGCMLFCRSCEIHVPSSLRINHDPGIAVYGGTSSVCT